MLGGKEVSGEVAIEVATAASPHVACLREMLAANAEYPGIELSLKLVKFTDAAGEFVSEHGDKSVQSIVDKSCSGMLRLELTPQVGLLITMPLVDVTDDDCAKYSTRKLTDLTAGIGVAHCLQNIGLLNLLRTEGAIEKLQVRAFRCIACERKNTCSLDEAAAAYKDFVTAKQEFISQNESVQRAIDDGTLSDESTKQRIQDLDTDEILKQAQKFDTDRRAVMTSSWAVLCIAETEKISKALTKNWREWVIATPNKARSMKEFC